MKLHLKHPETGVTKTAPIGISWTSFFFGPFPALFRGDVKWSFIYCCIAWTFIGALIFCIKYNKIFIKGLLEKGFKVASVEDGDIQSAKLKLQIDLPTAS